MWRVGKGCTAIGQGDRQMRDPMSDFKNMLSKMWNSSYRGWAMDFTPLGTEGVGQRGARFTLHPSP